jgi:hypothetical protein
MTRLLLTLAAIAVLAQPAAAQTQFYVGGTVAADSADRGSMNLRTVPVAAGLVGWRIDTLRDYAREGYAVLAIWKSRPLGRVTLAASMGVAERRFRTTRTIGVNRPVNLPPDDPLLQNREGTTRVAGPAGGVMLPIALGGGWSVAPEIRVGFHFTSEGIYGDGVYLPVFSGVRVMWGF